MTKIVLYFILTLMLIPADGHASLAAHATLTDTTNRTAQLEQRPFIKRGGKLRKQWSGHYTDAYLGNCSLNMVLYEWNGDVYGSFSLAAHSPADPAGPEIVDTGTARGGRHGDTVMIELYLVTATPTDSLRLKAWLVEVQKPGSMATRSSSGDSTQTRACLYGTVSSKRKNFLTGGNFMVWSDE